MANDLPGNAELQFGHSELLSVSDLMVGFRIRSRWVPVALLWVCQSPPLLLNTLVIIGLNYQAGCILFPNAEKLGEFANFYPVCSAAFAAYSQFPPGNSHGL
jgi:hypothetical protein